MEHLPESYNCGYSPKTVLNQEQMTIEEGILEAIKRGTMTEEIGRQCLEAYQFGLNSVRKAG